MTSILGQGPEGPEAGALAPEAAAPTQPAFLTIGKVVTTFGVRGELKVESLTDEPKRFAKLKSVRVVPNRGEPEELGVESARVRGDGVVLLKFVGFDAPETAAKWRGAKLEVPFTQARRKPGTVLFAEMPGMTVVDAESGHSYGTVVDVWRAVQDLIVVKTPTQDEALVPWVPQIVVKVDLEARQVLVSPPSGLLD